MINITPSKKAAYGAFFSAPLPIALGRARTKKATSNIRTENRFCCTNQIAISFRSSPDSYREGSNQKSNIKKGCVCSLFFPLLSLGSNQGPHD